MSWKYSVCALILEGDQGKTLQQEVMRRDLREMY